MNLTDLRSRAREILDEDSTGFSTTLIDLFADDAVQTIVASDRHWGDHETSAALSVTSGTQQYDLTDTNLFYGTPPIDVKWVVNTDDWSELQHFPYNDAIVMYGDEEGTSESYSVYGGDIYLWPNPSADMTLSVIGQRRTVLPSASAGSQFDIPVELHSAVLYFVVAKYYARVEDSAMANFYMGMFASQIENAQNTLKTRNSHDHPLVYGGGGRIKRPSRFRWTP